MGNTTTGSPVSMDGGSRVLQMAAGQQSALYTDIQTFNQEVQKAVQAGQVITPYSDAADAATALLRHGQTLVQNYHGSNNAGMNDWAYKVVSAMDYRLTQALSEMTQGQNPLRNLAELGQQLEQGLRPATPFAPPVAANQGTVAGGPMMPVPVEGSQVQTLLDQGRAASTTGDKATLLSAAIAAMLAPGGSSAPPGSQPIQLPGANLPPGSPPLLLPPVSTMPAPAPLPPAPLPLPPRPIAERKVTGDELSSHLTADGAGISRKDGGYGVETGHADEIDATHPMTYTVGNDFSNKDVVGATVQLGKMMGSERGHQEGGSVEVWKDGKLVDTIKVNGSESGNVTVNIDKAFDKLVFKPSDNRAGQFDGSDFTLKGITLREQAPNASAPAPTNGAPAPNQPPVGQSLASDALKVVSELAQLAKSVGAPPQLVDQLADIARAIYSGMSQAGSPDVLRNGGMSKPVMQQLLQTIGSVVDQLSPSLPDTVQGRATMDHAIDLAGKLFQQMSPPTISAQNLTRAA